MDSTKPLSSATKRSGSSSWGQCPAPGNSTRRLPGIRLRAVAPVLDRDDRVGAAPDQQRRDPLGEVETVGCADPLALQVDDGPQCVDERSPRLAVGERGVAAGRLGEVGAGLESEPLEELGDRRPRPGSPSLVRSAAAPARSPGAPRPEAAGGLLCRGRRWKRAPGARSTRGTGRRTGARSRRRANARRRFRARSRAGRGGRARRWRRRPASSRPAASPSARDRAGPEPRPCSARQGGPSRPTTRPRSR